MTFCRKLETVVNHALLRKFFTPKSCSRKIFHFSHVWFRLQSDQVQQIVLPTLRRSAWNSHSESVLQTMISSESKEEREFAVSTILKIRGRNNLGNTKPRPRKLPVLNLEASKLQDMISWKGANIYILVWCYPDCFSP